MNPTDPSQNNTNPNQEQPIPPNQPPQFTTQPPQSQPTFNQIPQQPIGQPSIAPKKKSKGLVIGLSTAGGILIIGGVILTLFLTGVLGGNSAKYRASLIEKIKKMDSNSSLVLKCGEAKSIKDGNDYITLLKENNAEIKEQMNQMGSMLDMVTSLTDSVIQSTKDSCEGKSDDAEVDMNSLGNSDPDYNTDLYYDTDSGECTYTTEDGWIGNSNMMTEDECYDKNGTWTPSE
jgi:hypothetical protein